MEEFINYWKKNGLTLIRIEWALVFPAAVSESHRKWAAEFLEHNPKYIGCLTWLSCQALLMDSSFSHLYEKQELDEDQLLSVYNDGCYEHFIEARYYQHLLRFAYENGYEVNEEIWNVIQDRNFYCVCMENNDVKHSYRGFYCQRELLNKDSLPA